MKRELAGAFVITVALFVGTLWGLQPLKTVTDLRETMKRSAPSGLVAGQGKGYANRASGIEHQGQPQGRNSRGNQLRHNPDNQQQTIGRGGGFGRKAYAGQLASKTAPGDAEQLKGRDFVHLGKLETHSGTLIRINNDEWGLKTGGRILEIHMGPSEYRASMGFILNEGASVQVSGYIYENHLSVETIETNGQSIALRDENGRPFWAGSSYSRGGGRGQANNLDGSGYGTKGRT